MGRNKGLVALGVFLIVAGIGVLVFGFLQFQQARASSGWPMVTGKVLSSEVETQRKISNDERRNFRFLYLPDVEYVYSVNGTEYRSDRFTVQQTDHKNFEAAEADLAVRRANR